MRRSETAPANQSRLSALSGPPQLSVTATWRAGQRESVYQMLRSRVDWRVSGVGGSWTPPPGAGPVDGVDIATARCGELCCSDQMCALDSSSDGITTCGDVKLSTANLINAPSISVSRLIRPLVHHLRNLRNCRGCAREAGVQLIPVTSSQRARRVASSCFTSTPPSFAQNLLRPGRV